MQKAVFCRIFVVMWGGQLADIECVVFVFCHSDFMLLQGQIYKYFFEMQTFENFFLNLKLFRSHGSSLFLYNKTAVVAFYI